MQVKIQSTVLQLNLLHIEQKSIRVTKQQLTYSFIAPLQIRSPLGEISRLAQYLGVACRWVERVAHCQRHQGWNEQQVAKDRHGSLTPSVPTGPLFVFVTHAATYACGQIFNTPPVYSKNNYATAEEWQATTHCVRQDSTHLSFKFFLILRRRKVVILWISSQGSIKPYRSLFCC